jgi:hypothetical protein
MPQTLRTLLLTCLAWFMPLHALDATTGQWHSAEAAELSSAGETAWVAGDWLIDTRAPAAWVVPGVELAELQRSTASAAQLSVPTVPPADAVVQVLGNGAHLRPLHTVAPGERIAWDGHVWWVESVESAVDSATAAVTSGSADPDGAEGPAPVDVTAAVEPPAALHVTLQATGLRLQRVLATRARPADDVHTLTIRSADGTLQSIRGTADHPVYVQGGDTFQALATLRPGDAVRALDGRPSTVVAVTPDPGPRTVHNLTVEFAPTYFIEAEVREGWGGIWVHNSCNQPRGGVYTLTTIPTTPGATPTVVRTGMTNDLARREREHNRTCDGLQFNVIYRSDDRSTRLGLEQMLHERPILNRNAPISSRNIVNGPRHMANARSFLLGLAQ